ncbi:pyridoxal-phosphate dependent enzyme [Marinobacter subterrani]|uniref:Pyridoxal-phosphate dependent enzyme n=1 Tax=Marinobacter subterrani TaxID=1658765 RepID=A0A0J7M7G3_9GAMM|nr:Pyridoxal-phosphate dependent enzyme [Marinobacter subterrani]
MTKPTLPDQPQILEAEQRIRQQLGETPLLNVPDLDAAMGQPLGLKCESLQRTGSFKARGALNWLMTARDDELSAGLVTVSAGNHAIALAWAAAMQKVPLTVVMPEGSSPLKISRTRALGAEVIVEGTIQQAVALCHDLRDQKGLTLVHPYNDVRIMAGQGTVGLELLRQQPDVDRVLCPIGGGGRLHLCGFPTCGGQAGHGDRGGYSGGHTTAANRSPALCGTRSQRRPRGLAGEPGSAGPGAGDRPDYHRWQHGSGTGQSVPVIWPALSASPA